MLDVPRQTTDALADLELLVPELPAAQQRASFGEELDRMGTWLHQRADQIAAFSAMIKACGDLRGTASASDVLAVRKNLDDVAAFGDALEKAEDGPALGRVREEMCGDTSNAMAQCQAALKRVAHDLVTKEFLPLRSTGQLIGELDQTLTLGARLVAFANRVATLGGVPSKDFAALVHSALAEAAGYRAEIEQLAHEPDQKEFLNALVAGTATLANVTPTILDWLGRVGALDRFAVRPQSQVR